MTTMLDDREQLAPSHRVSDGAQAQKQPSSAEPAVQPNQAEQSREKPPASSRLRVIAGVVGLLALGAGTYFGHSWWTVGRYMVATDDAYVGAKNSTLSPKVSGYIADVTVEDNAQVRAGDVI